jgi:hypothetical protein
MVGCGENRIPDSLKQVKSVRCHILKRHKSLSNRSQVWGSALRFGLRPHKQGSTFRVKDKEGIKDPKPSLKMIIFSNNCQLGSKFWNRPDEAYAFVENTHPKCSPEAKMESPPQTRNVKMW